MYHQIGEFQRPTAHRAGYCHVRQFRAQMSYLKRFGYHVISLEAALDGLFDNASILPRSVVLTFDDGYQNFADHAFPVLQAHGFPATVYMITGLIGDRARWLAEDGRHAPDMLDGPAIRNLADHGITFGSHTVNHPRLSRLQPAQVRAELTQSKAQLEDVLGKPVDHFCYPYGDYNPATRGAVIDAGYQSALTCIRGAANTADNRFEIPRKAISFGDNLIGYFWKLHMKHRRKDRA